MYESYATRQVFFCQQALDRIKPAFVIFDGKQAPTDGAHYFGDEIGRHATATLNHGAPMVDENIV